jgi:hypothetical protein
MKCTNADAWQLVGLATEKLACDSRQKSRLLPAAKKLLWRKKRLGDFFPIGYRCMPMKPSAAA